MDEQSLEKPKGKKFPCEICGTLRHYKPSQFHFKHRYCSRECQKVGYRTQFRGENNPAFGKTFRSKETHPEWAKNISSTMILREVNVGDKNGMKKPEVALQVSKTRSKKFREDTSFREQVANYTRQAWAEGKYDNAKTGKCKWYDHLSWKGDQIKLQGTWEVAFARRLDELRVDYTAHKGKWSYEDTQGIKRSYLVDFYIPMWNVFVDVKGSFWDAEQFEKISFVRISNPDKTLLIATRDILESWHVQLQKTQKELLK